MLWIFLSPILWALCYPPFPLGPLAFFVLIPAMVVTAKLPRKKAFTWHFFGGIAYNLIMYWWIYNVMKVGPALVIGLGLIVLILFLSLFNAILGWLFRILLEFKYGLIAYPFLWAGLEVLRTKGEMSFPWNDMGYTLGQHISLIQAASGFGIFGISITIVATNCLGFKAWQIYASGKENKNRAIAWGLVALLLPIGLFVYGQFSLAEPNPTSQGEMDISLVQPSIPQTKKWDENYFQEVMLQTWGTIHGKDSISPTAGSDLIVLAETAIPDFLRSRGDVYAQFQSAAKESGSDYLIGALDFTSDPKPYHAYKFYNSAFLFSANKNDDTVLQYSKLRLVPFSERLPFDDVFPLINYVNLGEGDFSTGNDYAIWKRAIPYAPSICYEIIYPDFARGARKRGAQLLVNITNDGWFGFSNAPFQHANIARFRSIEVGAPIARCSNAGVSIFYDFKGRILGKSKLQEVTVLRRKISISTKETLYLRIGDIVENILFWIFNIGFLFCGIYAWIFRGRFQI